MNHLIKFGVVLGVATVGFISSTFFYKSYLYSKKENDGSAYKGYEKKTMIRIVTNNVENKVPGA